MARRGGQSRSPVRALSRPAAIRYRLLEGDSHVKGIRTHGCAFQAPYRASMLAIDRFRGSCIRTSASRRSNETVTADLAAVA